MGVPNISTVNDIYYKASILIHCKLFPGTSKITLLKMKMNNKKS